jgi:hypothetical protein
LIQAPNDCITTASPQNHHRYVILSERSESKDLQLLLLCAVSIQLGRINSIGLWREQQFKQQDYA